MIFRLEQISRLPERKHIIKDKVSGKVFCTAGVAKVFNAELDLPNGTVHIVTESISRTVVFRNGMPIGEISQKLYVTKKVLFLPIGYEYYDVMIDGRLFQMYESGHGAGHHYISIYFEDVTIAVIHKDDRVVNYLNTYTIYSEFPENMNIALICAMFLESTAFCDRSSGIGNTDINSPYYTSQKELRDKFDPSFVKRIVDREGH